MVKIERVVAKTEISIAGANHTVLSDGNATFVSLSTYCESKNQTDPVTVAIKGKEENTKRYELSVRFVPDRDRS